MIYPADTFEAKIGFTTVRRRVAEHCASAPGAEWCESIRFSTDFAEVEHSLLCVAEMKSIAQGDAEAELPLASLRPVEPMLEAMRVEGTFPTVEELLALRTSLEAVGAIVALFARARQENLYPHLDRVVEPMQEFPLQLRAIDRVLDRFGQVRDSASPELAQIRRDMASAQGSMAAAMRRVLSSAVAQGIVATDATASVRDGRLVIPVNPMHKRKIQGIVHDESASGKTVYIEPAEVVAANNRMRELQMDERREVNRILTSLSNELRPYAPAMLETCAVAAQLDFIHAKALYAISIDGQLPHLSAEPLVEWYHACHPGLLESLRAQGKAIVPLDITLTAQNRLLIISGPNAGGKSVTLKTVGIVQYMLQCGLLPPLYENSHAGLFDDIFIDIGDDQSLENDLSTYSSHLTHMKQFMARGRGSSLVLIDEFGGGTEPTIGGAIAQAILARFASLQMWGVITTHYQNLKLFAEQTPGLINGSMLYDRQRMEPMFRLAIGTAGSSFAVEIARKIGLPDDIIATAQEIVGSDYVNMDKYLLDIARDRRYWENKRHDIRQKEKKLDQTLANYEADAETLRSRRREIIADAKAQAQQILDGSNAAIQRTINDIRRIQAEKEETKSLRERLRQESQQLTAADTAAEHPLLKKAPKARKPKPSAQPKAADPITVGSYVKLDGSDTPGQVLAIEGKNATVSFGMLKTTVKLDRLRLTMARPKTEMTAGARLVSQQERSRQLDFKQEIDVRGMRADEAIQAVTYFVDDAIRFNCPRIRILHGTGTGALRQSIRQYLSTVGGVASFADEDVRFGGAGITVVTF
jgi:DNA mismatch repair protein MutS2